MLFPILPVRIHGVIDYVAGVFFIVSPWIFGYHYYGLPTAAAIFLGVVTLAYTLFTDYPPAPWRKIPVFIHLWFDVGVGLLMLLSPFLLGFAFIEHWPQIWMGLAEIGAALITVNPMSLYLRHMDAEAEAEQAHQHSRPGMA